MTEPRNTNSNIYKGGGHFEFASEKNWGVEQDDCKIFNSIDVTHLADSISSVPFNLRHNIPVELFTVEQLEEFEVEASLALSRHTFQCNTKLKNKPMVQTSTSHCQTSETDKLMKLILNNFSNSEENVFPDHKIQPNGQQLDAILGNIKPLINMLQDETFTVKSRDTRETNLKIVENQMVSVKIDPEIETTNDSASHWLDSMLDSDD